MTLSDFFRTKNYILYNETGLILVPKKLILDENPQNVGKLNTYSDSGCCPYCSMFNVVYDDGFEDCSQCPLEKALNGCSDHNSTYQGVYRSLKTKGKKIHELPAIQSLVKKWNTDLEQKI